MENTYGDTQKNDGNKCELFYSFCRDRKLAEHSDMFVSEAEPWILVKGEKPGRTLSLMLLQLLDCDNWFQELFLKQHHGQGNRIPKHLVSLDEIYLRRCLEVILMNSAKGAPCALSVNLGSLSKGLMFDYVTVLRRNSLDESKYSIDYPLNVESRDSVINPAYEEIVGSVMGSSSMMSILRNPLFLRFGISDHEAKLGGNSLLENKTCVPTDFQGSPHRLTFSPSLSQKPGKEAWVVTGHDYRSDHVQKSPVSGGLCLHTKYSSASYFCASVSHGMLQCTWKDGIPHFAFSLDDQKELYVANAWKVEESNDKAVHYVYSFHLKPSGQKMSDIYGDEFDIIGKMKVSTSFSLCSNNSKIIESEFVLVGANEPTASEMHVMTPNSRRSRKFSKVMEVFKSGHTLKQRTSSVLGCPSTVHETSSAEQACSNVDYSSRPNLSASDFLPNLEVAAIVVKSHLHHEDHQKEELGGWGLKFLKKTGVKQNVASLDACSSSGCCQGNAENCTISMDIIVPAGPHGGPKTTNRGPTSLIERWRSGGHCDCGGWDIGCPLKVLKARPRRDESSQSSVALGDCRSFDLFTEGSKQETPTMKMVNIHENLYFISFQSSSLSALQCFSTAVAIVHSHSPSLRPKHVQS